MHDPTDPAGSPKKPPLTPAEMDPLVAGRLPAYRDEIDPASPQSVKARSDLVRTQGNRVLTANAEPDLVSANNSYTTKLNAQYGQTLKPPLLVAVPGLAANNDGSPAHYDVQSDTVQFDPDFLGSNPDPRALDAILGHELDHRYKLRTEEGMQMALKMRISDEQGREYPPEVYATARKFEAEADKTGAGLTSPADMQRGLGEAVTHNPTVTTPEYYQDRTGKDAGTFNALPAADQQQWKAEYAALPDNDKAPFQTAALNKFSAGTADEQHPSFTQRNAQMESLIKEAGITKMDLSWSQTHQENHTAPPPSPGQAPDKSQAVGR